MVSSFALKFVSQKLGLFQSTVFNRRPASEDYPLVSSIFPLLGEVVLDEAGIAKIITRIPNSIVLLIICSLITFFGFTFLSNGIKAEPAFAIGGILFIIVSFFMERSGVHVRFQKIKEYILENT